MLILASLVASVVLLGGAGRAYSEEALIAVASNFAGIAAELESDFERATDHDLRITSGSTGKLYAQIVHGAPYDVFLAADRERPSRLVEAGYALAGTQRTYARGRLLVVASSPEAGDVMARLSRGDFKRLAIANPELAPYGRAALEVLRSLGMAERVSSRRVMGENIGQTYALVATGNADLGFVAASQRASATRGSGDPLMAPSFWRVPSSMHTPIRQDLVLLRRAEENTAARAFLTFLASPEAQARIATAGYEVE